MKECVELKQGKVMRNALLNEAPCEIGLLAAT